MLLSNVQLQGIRDQVRSNALVSFEFFANTVLYSNLPTELCREVQDVVEDQEDYTFYTSRPRSLAVALRAWLGSKGVTVLSTVQLPELEILDWLSLQEEVKSGVGVTLDVTANTVGVTWL